MRVLVVDDEPAICDVITVSFGMRWPDVEVVCARTGRAGVVAARTSAPDLIILDLGLPDLDGFSLCLELAQLALAPIVILSVKSDEMDKVKGLELGADDYIPKPFSHLELQARLQAILRRYDTSARDPAPPYEGGRLCIDFGSREINVDGDLVKLTPIEYRLLSLLVQNVNRVGSHKDLLSEVWGQGIRGPGRLPQSARPAAPGQDRRGPGQPPVYHHGARRRLPVRGARRPDSY